MNKLKEQRLPEMEKTSNKSCSAPKHLKRKPQVILKVGDDVLDIPLDLEPWSFSIVEILNAPDYQAIQPLITCPELVRHETPHTRNPITSSIAKEHCSLKTLNVEGEGN